jgi:hypothetical protein
MAGYLVSDKWRSFAISFRYAIECLLDNFPSGIHAFRPSFQNLSHRRIAARNAVWKTTPPFTLDAAAFSSFVWHAKHRTLEIPSPPTAVICGWARIFYTGLFTLAEHFVKLKAGLSNTNT